MQAAAPEGSPSALTKLLLYLAGVMMIGALLATPLFHLGRSTHAWLTASEMRDAGIVRWLITAIEQAHFNRYFNRAVLVGALVLIWPFLRWVGVDRQLVPAWRPVGRGLAQFALSFALAAGGLLLLGWLFLQMGAYKLKPDPNWFKFGTPISSALGAGIIEEFFFRGLLLSLLLRTMSRTGALISGTFIFAIVHFLKPPDGWQIPDAEVTWTSGFIVLQQIARGFGSVDFLVAEFATLFAVGWVLAQARMRTGALWAGIGLHAGWVFGLKYFSALTFAQPNWLPWIGPNLKIGLAPLAMVLATGWVALRSIAGAQEVKR